MVEDTLVEAMCDFALTIQALIQKGWMFEVEYGDRRFRITTKLKAKKNDREIIFDNISAINHLDNLLE